MKTPALLRLFVIFVLSALPCPGTASAQAGYDDDRIILQGFYWESYRHGAPERFPALGEKKWYQIVDDKAKEIGDGRFDLIWLPPPSFAGKYSAGYNPKEFFNLNNSYGTLQQQRSMLHALLANGVEPVADIVINHGDGATGWGNGLQERIKDLINARKSAAVHAGSKVHTQQNARQRGVYAAYVEGSKGALYVRIGGSNGEWTPAQSGYREFREYAWGSGWKVWIGLPGNPEVRQAPRRSGLPIPQYQAAQDIAVNDNLID
jgi:hypothetical protein